MENLVVNTDYLEGLKTVDVDLAIYDYKVKVAIDDDSGAFARVLGTKRGIAYAIFSTESISAQFVAHEIMHILDELEKQIQDHLTNEPRAYLVEFLMIEIHKALDKLMSEKEET